MSAFTLLMAAAGVPRGSGWFATLGGSSEDYAYSVTLDASGNAYAGGSTKSQGQGSTDALVLKYDSTGAIQWQKTLGGSSIDAFYGAYIDASDNLYVAGTTASQGQGSNDFLLVKYNASGTLQWQRALGTASASYAELAISCVVDSSGNVYASGYVAPNRGSVLTKYNSSGTLQWQVLLDSTGSTQFRGTALDSSGNVYVVGSTTTQGAGVSDLLIVKYNSSGTIQWQRSLGGSGNDYGEMIAIDSSDNVYVVGRTASEGAGGNDLLLAKYNASGAIQWQRVLGGTGGDGGYGVSTDSDGNVYAVGYATVSSNTLLLLAKYNASGTLQWQRTFGGTGTSNGNSVKADASGNLYVTGYTNVAGGGLDDAVILKIPADGELTGTYGSFTYAGGSLTAATSTLTDAARTLTASAGAFTGATTTLTAASATLTSTKTAMP